MTKQEYERKRIQCGIEEQQAPVMVEDTISMIFCFIMLIVFGVLYYL